MNILTMLLWLKSHWKAAVNVICVASVALLIGWGSIVHHNNIKLSQELEMAQNNIEAYQGLLDSSQQANNVLRLDIEDLQRQNDITLHKLDSIRNKLKLKKKSILTAATQSQVLNVNDSKGVGGDLTVILKDTTYTDTLQYNNLTKVYYTIGKDTVNIALDIENEQYLYIYTTKSYKNPDKNFIQRLFTWDWKKIERHQYTNYNTNELLKSNNIRIVETTKK